MKLEAAAEDVRGLGGGLQSGTALNSWLRNPSNLRRRTVKAYLFQAVIGTP